jgi:type IV pilus assembly protein PilQ
MKAKTLFSYALSLWLAGTGLALAQAKTNGAPTNSIEAVDVSQQGGKIVVRVTTKEPLRAVPPNFTIASPARIAFDFPNTVNALGRSSQDVGQGELRSMTIVQGADRARLVLNLRRPVSHEASVTGARF